MKTFKFFAILIAAATRIGCASIHSGNYAVSPDNKSAKPTSKAFVTDSKILVSGAEYDDVSSTYFSMLDFTFENKSSKWIQVTKVTLDFGSANANSMIAVPVGEQLVSWSEAAQQQKAISDQNTAVILSSIAAVGSVAALSSGDAKAKGLGGAVAVGAAGGLTIQNYKNELASLELSKVVPESHLMSSSFLIPPGLHAKKWITLYTEKPQTTPYVSEVTITLTLSIGKTESVKVPFRSVGFVAGSEWQRGHYDSPGAIRERERSGKKNPAPRPPVEE